MKFCVIGLGRFGQHVAATLAENGMEVMVIDDNESTIATIRDDVAQAMCMRVSTEEALRTISIEEMDTVIVAMAEDVAQSILLTALLKKRIKIKNVIARATNDIHEEILKLIGADQVIQPEREMGYKLAYKLSSPFLDMIKITNEFAITQIITPAAFVGKSIGELRLYENYKVRCIGIKKADESMVIDTSYVVTDTDKLLIAGHKDDLDTLGERL